MDKSQRRNSASSSSGFCRLPDVLKVGILLTECLPDPSLVPWLPALMIRLIDETDTSPLKQTFWNIFPKSVSLPVESARLCACSMLSRLYLLHFFDRPTALCRIFVASHPFQAVPPRPPLPCSAPLKSISISMASSQSIQIIIGC